MLGAKENKIIFLLKISGTKKTWLAVCPECYSGRTLPAYILGDGTECKPDNTVNSGYPILDKLPSPQKHFQMTSFSWFIITQGV